MRISDWSSDVCSSDLAGDGGVEEIAGAAGRVDQGAVLAAVEVGRAETGHEVLQRQHGLGVAAVAGDGGDALAGHALQVLGDGLACDAPGHRPAAAGAAAQLRTSAPLATPASPGVARLVVDPL